MLTTSLKSPVTNTKCSIKTNAGYFLDINSQQYNTGNTRMSHLTSVEYICSGEPLWDSNLTWNTTSPDFTRCFQKTILQWIPCIFLVVFAPLRIFFLPKANSRSPLPNSQLSLLKKIINQCLAFLSLLEILMTVSSLPVYEVIGTAEFITPLSALTTLFIGMHVTELERQRHVRSSGFMLVFWFLMTISAGLIFQSKIRALYNEESFPDMVDFTMCCLRLGLTLIQLTIVALIIEKDDKSGEKNTNKKGCLGENSTFLSKITLGWYTSLVREGYSRSIKMDDMFEVPDEVKSEKAVSDFEKIWNAEDDKLNRKMKNEKMNDDINGNNVNLQKAEVSLVKVLLKANMSGVFLNAFNRWIRHCMEFLGPVILKLMIDFANNKDDYLWHGVVFGCLSLTNGMIQSIMCHYDDHNCHLMGFRMRTSIMGAIYRKVMKLSNEAKKSRTVGEMVNLMSVDADRFTHILFELHYLWIGPVQVIGALYFLYQEIGISAFAGFSLLLIFVPINAYVAKKNQKLNKEGRDLEDERTKVMNEVFNGMKVLKLYAWEPSFQKKIQEIREKEQIAKKKRHLFGAICGLCWGISQFFIMFVIFAVYLLCDDRNAMTAQTVFVTISLFNILRGPVLHLPHLITHLGETRESLKRLQNFLNSEEIDGNAIKEEENSDNAVKIQNASFSWNRNKKTILKKISIDIKKGDLVAIVGAVGAGKSSLLSAILGEMEKQSGDVSVNGSVAYVSQLAWIQNLTLKDNILFGKELHQKLYDEALDTCALRSDLNILPGGDETEIGEKGINLSNGQKQRVSLARAVYQDADIYLFDDPLSAVDAHVGKHIFNNVLGRNGILKDKTRVLVTHALSFLPKVNKIVTLVDGEISEVGTYAELIGHNGPFSELVRNHLLQDTQQDVTDESSEDSADESCSVRKETPKRQKSVTKKQSEEQPKEKTEDNKKHSKFVEEETVESGKVKWTVYQTYVKAAGSFLVVVGIICLLANLTEYSLMFWLSDWSNDHTKFLVHMVGDNVTEPKANTTRNYRLGVYGIGGLFKAFLSLCGEFAILVCAIKASRTIHDSALGNIMRAPLSFFDTTPIGRIINRFSKDIGTIDGSLPWITKSFLEAIPDLMLVICFISYGTPQFVFGLIPICFVYFFIQRLFSTTSVQLRRICSNARSPQFSHFSESINGATTIRAFNKKQLFTKESDRRIDQYNNADITNILCYRWNAIRIDLLSNLIVFCATLFAALNRGYLSPGMFALVMTYADNITGILHWIVHIFNELDINIVSVERLQEYIETKQEAEWRIEDKQPVEGWPQKGEVQISDFGLRYREGLDLVLKGINCDISPGEKIGIVGRTGAGKSSLTLGLFRIIEKAQGSITIDGVDISTIGLHDLRSKLTIIPQDPVIFSGTIRSNLDPFKQHSDEDIWKALQHAHLKKFIESLEDGLMHECTEGGENLSVGQRQLVCLARALLRKTKILVLDEATAAVDLEMDELIQRTIREEFSDCTILTIAHRLNTVMDYSRIMVLKEGQIAELDSPDNLLLNKDSIFYSMAKDANLV